ncbi:MAG: helix-turn-helix domain-containing protein [Geminicoccaceae bacterium]
MAEFYHYTESGLDYVYLANGFDIRETERGEMVSFVDLDGLHRAIGHFIVTGRRRLSGAEMRYLRQELGLSQAALARLLGATERTVARWETGHNKPSPAAEGALRLLYQEHTEDQVQVAESFRRMVGSEEQDNRRLELVENHGWDRAA